MRIIDLSAGLGGFITGFKKAGHDVLFACEDKPVKSELLRRNFPDIKHANDICSLNASDIPHADVVSFFDLDVQKFPCFLDIVRAIRPTAIVSCENAVEIDGYMSFSGLMNTLDFGLRFKRRQIYTVWFRSDRRYLFKYFPFPDASNKVEKPTYKRKDMFKLPPKEVAACHGYPENYSLPSNKDDAINMMMSAPCPTIVSALAEEIMTWIP